MHELSLNVWQTLLRHLSRKVLGEFAGNALSFRKALLAAAVLQL